MPGRNTVKEYDSFAYYHVYNRGVEKRAIFLDDEDYAVFLNIMKRHLDDEPHFDKSGREYERLNDVLKVVAFCLMPNHFHIMLSQEDAEAMTRFMRKLATAYSVYFNHKYKREGRLFQGPYRAVRITADSHFEHIARYIHLNPSEYLSWKWSSLDAFLGYRKFRWVHPELVSSKSAKEYLVYLEDYIDYRQSLKEIKNVLAG